jgi:hypothetical protein
MDSKTKWEEISDANQKYHDLKDDYMKVQLELNGHSSIREDREAFGEFISNKRRVNKKRKDLEEIILNNIDELLEKGKYYSFRFKYNQMNIYYIHLRNFDKDNRILSGDIYEFTRDQKTMTFFREAKFVPGETFLHEISKQRFNYMYDNHELIIP